MIRRWLQLPSRQSFFLFGPRGVGKSTLLKSHFSKMRQSTRPPLWLDLLDSSLSYQLAQSPGLLLDMWQAHKAKWVVIDEVQKLPVLLDSVHKLIEDEGVRFALSGSSARKLKRGKANLLAGRAAAMHLNSLSCFELGSRFNLEKALSFGLLPQLWHQRMSVQESVRFLYSYVDVYLKQEVAAEQLVRQLEPFQRFLAAAAQSHTQIVNFTKIERDAGIASSQAQRHFEVLVDTLMGFFLPPYHRSLRKRQFQKSKFYFFDTGVVRALNLLSGESLNVNTYEYGLLFESFIVNEILKLAQTFEKRWKFSYFKSQSGVEVDLIIEKPRSQPFLLEIKSANRITDEHLRHLKAIKKSFPKSRACVWYCGRYAHRTQGFDCLPWQQGLKQLFQIN